MNKSDFKNGVRFYINRNYRCAYKVYTSPDNVMFIKKGSWYQGEVISILEDGVYVLTKVMDHDTDTFIPFSSMKLIPEENRY